jgi:hypothetical protein
VTAENLDSEFPATQELNCDRSLPSRAELCGKRSSLREERDLRAAPSIAAKSRGFFYPAPPNTCGSIRQSGLSRGQSGHRYPRRRATHVIEADAVEEHNRGGVAPVFPADAEL